MSPDEPEQPGTVSNMPQPSNEAEADRPPRVERRRPGRMAVVNPHLIPLLRGTTESLPDLKERGDSDLALPSVLQSASSSRCCCGQY